MSLAKNAMTTLEKRAERITWKVLNCARELQYKGAGNGDVVQEQLLYWMQYILQLQHNHKRTNKIRYPWPISAVANLSIVGAFDNMHKRYRYCWFIDATCAATAAHCTLSVSHSCSPSSSPWSALSRGWLSDLVLVCSSLLVQFFLCAQFRMPFLMFFYFILFLVCRRWEFITSVANWICQLRLLR